MLLNRHIVVSSHCLLHVDHSVVSHISLMLYRYTSQCGERYSVRVAFEIFIAPGSYRVCAQSIGLTEEIDPRGYSNSEIEWTTVQQGSNVLYGLLVSLDKLTANPEEDGL